MPTSNLLTIQPSHPAQTPASAMPAIPDDDLIPDDGLIPDDSPVPDNGVVLDDNLIPDDGATLYDAPILGAVAIQTHGCKLNQADSAVLADQFAAAGYPLTPSPAAADVIIVNTCTVTATADAKARQALRAARRANPDAVIVAAGCYSQRAAAELRQMPEVTLVIGNDAKPQLASLALAELAQRTASAPASAYPESPAPQAPDHSDTPAPAPAGILRRSRAMLKIQEGCDQVCAYCIVPKVRGRERSIPPAQLVQSVNRQIANGYQEVVLTGTQLGTYGFDLPNASLPALLDAILSATDLPRLRVSSLQAHEITPDLLSRWSDDARLSPHFHIPLQSGSDRTLHAMRRRYDTATFRRAVDLVRRIIPDAAITTDLIVGFPGETAADFAASRNFAAAMHFADIHIFPYSPRPGTSAHYLPDRIPDAVKRQRTAEMAAIKATGFNAFRRNLIGQTRPVLWETARPIPDADGNGNGDSDSDGNGNCNARLLWRGLTDNYIRVAASVPASPQLDLSSRITPARLTALQDDGVMTAELA